MSKSILLPLCRGHSQSMLSFGVFLLTYGPLPVQGIKEAQQVA